MVCWPPHPGGAVCRDHAQDLPLLPAPRKWPLEYLVHNLLSWACLQLFLVPAIQYLCVLLLKEMFVQVTVLQQRVSGPSLSQKEEEGKIEKETIGESKNWKKM